ncbi:MAG TPA: hypothetical protein VNI53_02870 [Gammaproteobacteria bacterium]|nr:hypothetical protein [Gammaproteobacteria bacterium]
MPDPKSNYIFIDNPGLAETYADSIQNLVFDGATFRFTLVVNRLDPPQPPEPPKGKQYPSCRLVMPLIGALTLYQNLQNMVDALEKQGIIKKGQPPQTPTQPITLQ